MSQHGPSSAPQNRVALAYTTCGEDVEEHGLRGDRDQARSERWGLLPAGCCCLGWVNSSACI